MSSQNPDADRATAGLNSAAPGRGADAKPRARHAMRIEMLPTPGLAVAPASASARRLQRAIAFAVVFLPCVGFGAAVVQVWKYGVGYLELGLLAGMYVVTVLGVSIGFHRHFAHRALNMGGNMRLLLAALGSMAAQGPLLFWVAVHRRHHAHSDREGDPHSPNLHGAGLLATLRGLWHSHVGWMFSDEITSWSNFARDVLQERAAFKIHQQYFFWLAVGLVVPAAVGGLVTGTWAGCLLGFLWGGLVRIFLVNQFSWCVGSVCHYFGSRPFETHDRSGNVYWVAFFTFGEGLQNNHHAFPSSAWHGLAWWQPDFSGWVIRALEAAGLVWDVKVPTPRAILEARKKNS